MKLRFRLIYADTGKPVMSDYVPKPLAYTSRHVHPRAISSEVGSVMCMWESYAYKALDQNRATIIQVETVPKRVLIGFRTIASRDDLSRVIDEWDC